MKSRLEDNSDTMGAPLPLTQGLQINQMLEDKKSRPGVAFNRCRWAPPPTRRDEMVISNQSNVS